MRPEFPPHKEDVTMPEPTRLLRNAVSGHFINLIESRRVPGLTTTDDIVGRITPIGGHEAAGYLFHINGISTAIKFNYFPAEREVGVLRKLGHHGVSVPEVIDYGVVPGTEGDYQPVNYIIMEGIELNKEPAPSGTEYIKLNPKRARELGIEMAKQTLAIHRIPIPQDLPTGDMADPSDDQPATIADYFADKIDKGSDILQSIGMTEDEIAAVKDAFGEISFPEELAMTHGGLHLCNILVEAEEPLAIKVIDPSPHITDPYWDIARYLNTYDLTEAFTREQYSEDPNAFSAAISHERELRDGLVEGYEDGIGQELDPRRLLANQIVFAIGHVERNEKREVEMGVAGVSEIPFQQEHRVAVIKQKLRDYVSSFMADAA